MKQLIPFALLFLFLFSCTKKDSDQAKLNNCKLTRIDFNNSSHNGNYSSGYYLFSYNNAGYVSEMLNSDTNNSGKTLNTKYVFTYNSDNQVIKEETFHTDPVTLNIYKSSETVFTYKNNLLNTSHTTHPNSTGNYDGEKEYQYDSLGRINTVTYVHVSGSLATEKYEYDTNNNLTKIIQYLNNAPYYISEFSNFDNKSNLFASVKGLYRPHDNKINGLGMLMPNNPGYVKYEWQNFSNMGQYVDEIMNISYSYGQNSLPTGWQFVSNNNYTNTSNLTYDCN